MGARSLVARRHRSVRDALLVGVVALMLVGSTVAVASASTPRAAKGGTEELTWAVATPVSMSPLKALAGNAPFLGLAYDPLFYISGTGEVTPALAVKWGFVGEGNTVFDVTLRSGVKFSDGTPLTADAAKAHFDAFKAGTTSRFRLAAMQSVDVTGPLTLRFTLSTPNPDFIRTLADVDTPGHIVSPAGLADQAKLDTTTAGAGPYVLDTGQSVTGDHYTFTKNPNYWNTKRARFDTITVRNITDPAAALSALQTGQADVGTGTLATAAAAQGSGLKVQATPQLWIGFGLIDRAGVVAKPLGDVRVRQALNLAVDRNAIVKGLYGEFGTATDGIATPGFQGFSEPAISTYPYNVKKAKQLMKAAGYADGFSMPLLASTTTDPNNNLTNAVADYWSKIGVKVDITNDPVNWAARFSSKQFPAAIDINGNGLIAQANSQLLPTGTSFNPFGSSDEQINTLFQQAVAAPAAQRDKALTKLADRVRELAWFVPVSIQETIVLSRSSAPKFTIGPLNTYFQAGEVQPSSAK